jgi:hypothetical protein
MVLGQQDLKIVRSDALLVLLLALDLVYYDVFILLLRVGSRIEAPEYLGHLAVETISWDFFAFVHMFFPHFVVLLLVLWQAVEHLEYRVHVASIADVVDTRQPRSIQRRLFLLAFD